MASSFPGALDVFTATPSTLAGPPTHSSLHKQITDALAAIEGALGVSPAGTYATVAARLAATQAAWTAYTPTWTAGGTPALGNGTLAGRYMQNGKTVAVRIRLTIGTTTNAGTGTFGFALPVPASGATDQLLAAYVMTSNNFLYNAVSLVAAGASATQPYAPISSANNGMAPVGNNAGVTVGVPSVPGNFSFSNVGEVRIQGTYETV